MADPGLTLKDVSAADDEVLFALYSAVRGEELRVDQLPAAQGRQLLKQQFAAQRQGYRDRFPAAAEQLILKDGEPIGWVIVDPAGSDLLVVDIGIVAAERSRGAGSQIIRRSQQTAAAEGRGVVLTVQRFNTRAHALYTRLGFRAVRETDVHIVMEWRQG